MVSMSSLKAVVHNGRLVLDTPTELPEGTVVELMEADGRQDEKDPFADMDPTERARLHTALDQSLADAKAGLGMPADEFLVQLRAR